MDTVFPGRRGPPHCPTIIPYLLSRYLRFPSLGKLTRRLHAMNKDPTARIFRPWPSRNANLPDVGKRSLQRESLSRFTAAECDPVHSCRASALCGRPHRRTVGSRSGSRRTWLRRVSPIWASTEANPRPHTEREESPNISSFKSNRWSSRSVIMLHSIQSSEFRIGWSSGSHSKDMIRTGRITKARHVKHILIFYLTLPVGFILPLYQSRSSVSPYLQSFSPNIASLHPFVPRRSIVLSKCLITGKQYRKEITISIHNREININFRESPYPLFIFSLC